MDIEWGPILDDDSLFRASIYPVSFKGKSFAYEKMVKLYDQTDGSLVMSLAWDKYVPTAEYIHGYGCRLAVRINEKKLSEGTIKKANRHVYSGSYHLKAGALRALPTTCGPGKISSADIIHEIEEGELAHANLRILPIEGSSIDDGTKTEILVNLWEVCSGPLKHACDCDHDVEPHPSLLLISPPAGAYIDTRSYLLRRWCIVRFKICSWFWRRFFKNSAR